MAAKQDTYEVIDDVRKCQSAVKILRQQRLVAFDAEGVNLGKYGPMTLIQVAMETGHVYLFDVYRHGRPMPEMFSEGGLKTLFESPSVLKVMHASSNDSVALKCQYDVTLANVYDIQVAQQVLDEREGRQLPNRKKLMEVCKLYLQDTSDFDDKDDVQAKWHLQDAEFWARRPFTKEMTDYACADVRLLIPEVHSKQRSLVLKYGLEAEVLDRVKGELRYRWDDEVKEANKKKHREKIFAVLRQIEKRHPRNVHLSRIEDEDELAALARIREEELETFSPTVRDLKVQYYRKEMAEIKENRRKEGASFLVKSREYFFLFNLKSHSDESIQRECKELLSLIQRSEVQHMSVKYRLTTPLAHVSEQDKKTLRFLKPGRETYTTIVTRLHWLVKEEDLDRSREMFYTDMATFRRTFHAGHAKHFRFIISSPVAPESLRAKAREFMHTLEAEGILRPPQRRPQNRRP